MATQGQRRQEAISAIRRLRAEYRKADSAGERVERELDRLIKRKTLISADQIQKVSILLENFVRTVDSIQKLYATVYELIRRLAA